MVSQGSYQGQSLERDGRQVERQLRGGDAADPAHHGAGADCGAADRRGKKLGGEPADKVNKSSISVRALLKGVGVHVDG